MEKRGIVCPNCGHRTQYCGACAAPLQKPKSKLPQSQLTLTAGAQLSQNSLRHLVNQIAHGLLQEGVTDPELRRLFDATLPRPPNSLPPSAPQQAPPPPAVGRVPPPPPSPSISANTKEVALAPRTHFRGGLPPPPPHHPQGNNLYPEVSPAMLQELHTRTMLNMKDSSRGAHQLHVLWVRTLLNHIAAKDREIETLRKKHHEASHSLRTTYRRLADCGATLRYANAGNAYVPLDVFPLIAQYLPKVCALRLMVSCQGISNTLQADEDFQRAIDPVPQDAMDAMRFPRIPRCIKCRGILYLWAKEGVCALCGANNFDTS